MTNETEESIMTLKSRMEETLDKELPLIVQVKFIEFRLLLNDI